MKYLEQKLAEKKDKFQFADEANVDLIELKGFSRSIAELEWLLVILVMLYLVTPGVVVPQEWLIIKFSVTFGIFVLAFRYLNFYRPETRWRLVIEIWVMIFFITAVLWYTGRIHSPLLNLYLLVIITSGLTLGKFHTLAVMSTIGAIYVFMGIPLYNFNTVTPESIGVLMTVFSPYLLIAYLTTMLSADLHYAKKMFKELSETDEMTGLDNLRSFKNTLSTTFNLAVRYKHIFSILMVDADGLKGINDKFGHDAGNSLIKSVASAIKSCLRDSDKLARYGGDEYILLLPETSHKASFEVAERIRKAVENTSIDMDGNMIKTTVSIGIASYPEHTDDIDELMTLADRALYDSKSSGRNKVSGVIVDGTDSTDAEAEVS